MSGFPATSAGTDVILSNDNEESPFLLTRLPTMSTNRNTVSGRPTQLLELPPSELRRSRRGILAGPTSAVVTGLIWLAMAIGIALLVACGDPAGPIPVATITVTTEKSSLASLGETTQLTAMVKDAQGNPIEGRAVTWTSSNPMVATVTNDAKVTAMGEGQATVTATAEGITGSATIAVAQVIGTIEITPANKQLVSIGETVSLTATPRDALGNAIVGRTIAWGSSSPTTVKIDAATGVATALANGTVTILATIGQLGQTTEVSVAQAPAKLVFLGSPFTTQNGATIGGVSVQVQDALGTRVLTGTSPVTVALETNPASGTLAGITQLMSSSANANFTTLSIDKPAVGYKLVATSPGLVAATSAAFEIMDVPMRIDSVKLASTAIKVGGSIQYSVFITNGKGQNATLAAVQGYVNQGTIINAAGGASIFNCGPTAGTILPGVCRMDWALNASNGTFTVGAATAKIELREGQTLRGTFTAPVTIVP
jgi:hypothetical protein